MSSHLFLKIFALQIRPVWSKVWSFELQNMLKEGKLQNCICLPWLWPEWFVIKLNFWNTDDGESLRVIKRNCVPKSYKLRGWNFDSNSFFSILHQVDSVFVFNFLACKAKRQLIHLNHQKKFGIISGGHSNIYQNPTSSCGCTHLRICMSNQLYTNHFPRSDPPSIVQPYFHRKYKEN